MKNRVLWPALFALFLAAAFVWHFHSFIKSSLIAACDLAFYNCTPSTSVLPVDARLVAHAGGAVNGEAYTNSREALDQHYAAGYRVFELDFEWTSDGHLVLVHDWPHTSSLFGVPPHVFNSMEFVSGMRRDGLHQMTFEDLRAWLLAHRDAFIVTDTKASNQRLLAYLQTNGSAILPQLILQIYRITELDAARRLDPRAVWLTVYRYRYPAWALARISAVDAFVIPVERYAQYRRLILAGRARFYVHSVFAAAAADTFHRCPGIYGIYVN